MNGFRFHMTGQEGSRGAQHKRKRVGQAFGNKVLFCLLKEAVPNYVCLSSDMYLNYGTSGVIWQHTTFSSFANDCNRSSDAILRFLTSLLN